MSPSGIRITRKPYEEPHHLNLVIEAWNERINGLLEFYCNLEGIKKLGKQLADFAGDRDKEIVYELGSELPQDRFAFFLSLRVRPLDSLGHCAVMVRLNNNQDPPARLVSEFSIRADVADLNRLGELLIHFSRLQHRVLDWGVQEGRLLETNETAV